MFRQLIDRGVYPPNDHGAIPPHFYAFFRSSFSSFLRLSAPVFPLYFLVLPSLPFHPILSEATLYNQLGSLGERCKLPSGVWGEAPADIDFGVFWEGKRI